MALALVDLARGRRPESDRPRRPELTVIATRRRNARVTVGVGAVIAVGLAVLGVLHTQIAANQRVIDRLDRSIATANEQFDTLRALRAELRAPVRLDAESRALGMEPAMSSSFLPVDPQVLATTLAATGGRGTRTEVDGHRDPLDQFRLVKAIGAQP
jgi:hypothetical protein